MAEWSKALVLGTSPKGRGFESHRCQHSFAVAFEVDKINLETPGIEPGASRMRSERSTTELHPPATLNVWYMSELLSSLMARLAEWSKA